MKKVVADSAREVFDSVRALRRAQRLSVGMMLKERDCMEGCVGIKGKYHKRKMYGCP